MQISRRDWLAGTAAAFAAGPALAQGAGGPFVTRHRGAFGGEAVEYAATVGETVLGGAEPVRFVTTSYVRTGPDPARRPVLFAFNGGPSAASSTLHMVAIGPKRIAIAQDPK